MGTFSLEIDTNNAAFRNEDDSLDIKFLQVTLDRAISRLTGEAFMPDGTLEMTIRDVNGNTVGTLFIDESDY